MQILLIMLIVVLLAFSVLLLALAKQSPREKQTEDKEQEEYIRDYAETVRQTGGSMKKLEHWKVIAIYLIIYDICKCKPYIENRNRHRIRSCTIRKRSRQQRKSSADMMQHLNHSTSKCWIITTKSISLPDTCTSPESRESLWSRDTRSSSKWQKKGLPATYITNHCQ